MVALYQRVDIMPPSQRWVVSVSPEPERLNVAIKRFREAAGLSNKQAAPLAGFTSGRLSSFESGQHNPTDDAIRSLAKVYGVHPSVLFRIQTDHDLWEKTREPLPGDSLAVPTRPQMVPFLNHVVDVDDERIPDLERAVIWVKSGVEMGKIEETLRDILSSGYARELTPAQRETIISVLSLQEHMEKD